MVGTPPAEVNIDTHLVQNLLQEQHPDLAGLSIQAIDAGWDNAIFRLGDRLCARLPRRQAAATLIENEQAWLPRLTGLLPIPIPTPTRVGVPSGGFPWRWSVAAWLPGRAAAEQEPDAGQATALAAFLRALHIPAPATAPANPARGVPLAQRAGSIEERMARLDSRTDLITPAVRSLWVSGLSAEVETQARWIHGDLHARNVLVEGGTITGIIDWGDITAGDTATDLASIWMLFADRHAREAALAAYGDLTEATLRRAKGWAVYFGVVLTDTGLVDSPLHARMGERTLRRVAADV